MVFIVPLIPKIKKLTLLRSIESGGFMRDELPGDPGAEFSALHATGGTARPIFARGASDGVTCTQTLTQNATRDGGLLEQVRIGNRGVGFMHAGRTAEVKIDTFNF